MLLVLNATVGTLRCKVCSQRKTATFFTKTGGQQNSAFFPSSHKKKSRFESRGKPSAVLPAEQRVENKKNNQRAGSFRDPPEFKAALASKPKYGSGDDVYWAWHDSLYLGGGFASPEWEARSRDAKIRDEFRCVCCGAEEDLETDHIIELSRGGSNDMDNLQTLCWKCHDEKTDANRRKAFRR